MRPEALIHSEAMQLVSDANALEQTAANHRWLECGELMMQMQARQKAIVAAIAEIAEPKNAKGDSDIPRQVPVTNIDRLRDAFGMTGVADAPAKDVVPPKATTGTVATKPTI